MFNLISILSSIISSKSITYSPSANYSGSYTTAVSYSPDTGYDAMESVTVQAPLIRDYSMLIYSTTDSPGTIYKGDTSYSNSKQLIRLQPYKNGMIFTGTYLYIDPDEIGASGSSGGSVIFVQPIENSATYPYVKGLNTWTFTKSSFGISTSKTLKTINFAIWTKTDRVSGTGYHFYLDTSLAKTTYTSSSTNSGAFYPVSFPATSSNKLGFQDNGSTVTISFYETSAVSGRVCDLILTFA